VLTAPPERGEDALIAYASESELEQLDRLLSSPPTTAVVAEVEAIVENLAQRLLRSLSR
jgi:hypothetical protein